MPRDIGPWTLDKLQLLRLYLPPYLQATTKALDRVYIDGFAGPGTNRLDGSDRIVDGSPLIALDAHGQRNQSAFTKLFFIEADPAVGSELRDALAARGADPRATVITGDVNVELPRIVRGLNRRAPIFVFLDTASIDPAWATIEAISTWQTELFINFPLGMAINRNANSPKVAAYFGTDAWRPLWEAGDENGLLRLYKDRLRVLGYEYQQEHDRLISTFRSQRGPRLYYMIPAAKHPAAQGIWEWVFRQPDQAGQGRLGL